MVRAQRTMALVVRICLSSLFQPAQLDIPSAELLADLDTFESSAVREGIGETIDPTEVHPRFRRTPDPTYLGKGIQKLALGLQMNFTPGS